MTNRWWSLNDCWNIPRSLSRAAATVLPRRQRRLVKGKAVTQVVVLQKEFLIHAPDMPKSSLPQILFSEHHESHAASAFFRRHTKSCRVMHGWSWRVGHHVGMAWRREQADSLWEIPFPTPLGCCILPLRTTQGLKWTLGSTRWSGPGSVWRTEVCESHLRTSTRFEAGWHLSAEYGLL